MFSGYAGIDMAIASVLHAETVFFADVCGDPKTKHWPHRTPCKSPCSILAHRFPSIPNLGDVTTIDWTPWIGLIDILCAGFPCQDLSTAGGRAGLREGTRSGLWSQVVRAIVALNPRMVVLENVPGIFTAPAAGDVEPCEVCLGDEPDSHLRALHAVLADLAEIGFDAEWISLPASGVGAPHKRERWVCLAWPADGRHEGRPEPARLVGRPDAPVGGHADGLRLLPTVVTKNNENRPGDGYGPNLGAALALLSTPRTSDTNGAGAHGTGGPDLRTAVSLLPTPAVNDMGASYTPETWDAWTEEMRAKHGNGNGHGKSLSIEAQRLLPTPTTQDAANTGGPSQFERNTRPLNTEVLLIPTPSAADALGGHERRGGSRSDELLLNGLSKEIHRANTTEDRPDQVLPSVWSPDAPQEVQRSTGGQDTLPEPSDMLKDLREQQGRGPGGHSSLASAPGEAPRDMREMRDDPETACSPQGPGRHEQPPGQPEQPVRLLPSETALAGGQGRSHGVDFGPYEAAIQRWEAVLGRESPAPTEPTGKGGAHRLSPSFTEFLMGLPDGWITDVPGISRNEALKACGNGVVIQQIAEALRVLLARAGWIGAAA